MYCAVRLGLVSIVLFDYLFDGCVTSQIHYKCTLKNIRNIVHIQCIMYNTHTMYVYVYTYVYIIPSIEAYYL